MPFLGVSPSADGYNIPLLLLFLAVAILLFWHFSGPRMDPREPPLLRPAIPLVGHLIGMMTEQMNYYAILSRKSPFLNFTMPILNSKVYIITSPLLAQAALRHKDLDFTTFVTGIGLRPFGLSQACMDKIRKDSLDRKMVSYMTELHKLIYERLGPGSSLDEMNARMLSRVAVTLNNIGDLLEVDELWPWLQKTLTLATTYSLYGERDPFSADPSLSRAMWDYDEQVGLLLLGIFPSLIARRGYKGREAIQKAMANYFKAGYEANADASGLVRERGILHRKYGFTTNEQGKVELSIPWVGTTNAIPTLYWMLLYVASDPQLLEDLRTEVANVITTTGIGPNRTLTFNITKFNSECPLLLSAYQETIRLTNFQVSIRMVETDTILRAGSEIVLVKKGNVVQIPAGVMHNSTATWGPNPDVFDGRRFMKQVMEEKEQGKAKRSAYIPFGGGKHLCPGRHFAQAEILGMAAAVVTGFEVTNKDGEPVVAPKTSQVSRDFGQASGKPTWPAKKVGVKLIRREGMEHVKFDYSVQD